METDMRVAFINSQSACMLAQLEGMKAANVADTAAGRPLTFCAHDFFNLPDEYGLGHNTVVSYLTGQ